jgi:hypothetical protein
MGAMKPPAGILSIRKCQLLRCDPADSLLPVRAQAARLLHMKTVTLTAHFDGEHIRLDEPFTLPPDARLLVTVLPPGPALAERRDWYDLAKAGLARAYSEDEPDYPADLVRKRVS